MANCRQCSVSGGFFWGPKIDKYTGLCKDCKDEMIIGIEQGHLPLYQTSIRLSSEELCHLEMTATYHRRNKHGITHVDGRFVATNSKLHFLAPLGTYTINWNSVLQVLAVGGQANQLYLELQRQGGTGYYTVLDADIAIAVLDTLTLMSKRQILIPSSNTRQIPQHVKTAVWQRDGGRCVECGDMRSLEYDHNIPFSKGGANSINNIQLLCRSCNARKGSRI